MASMFSLHNNGDGTYTLEKKSSTIDVNPEEGSYMAMGRIKIPYRKTTGDAKKVLAAFERFLKKAKKLLQDNDANIYERENYSNDLW